jgi:hypothetical protein
VEGSGGLKGATIKTVYSPTEAERTKLEAEGATPLDLHELAPGQGQFFHDKITEAKTSDKYGAAVFAYPAADYDGMRTFLTDDGKAGFALKSDGDIVSAFKHADSKAEKLVSSILPLAIEQGGQRADAFDTVLPFLYAKAGMRTVARIPWNEQYAPEGWDKKTFEKYNGGEPDVVFLVVDKNTPPYTPGTGKTVEDYDAGVAEQSKQLARKTD